MTIKPSDSRVSEAQNLIKIKQSPKMNRTFTICLRPLHFNRTVAFDIVEWIEYYRLMGVDHFVIYNFTSDPLTDKVLRYYVNTGLLEVVQWHIPNHVIPKKHYYELVKYNEIHSAGQFAMNNDFLYRVYWSSKFVINVDLDEFIVPLDGSTDFKKLIAKLPSNVCHYLIRNTLFPLTLGQTKEQFYNRDASIKYNLKTVLYRKRNDYIFPLRWRTKYIAHTKCSKLLWLHNVLEYRESDLAVEKHVVDENTALVFHYRKPFEKPVFPIKQNVQIEDKRFQPFADALVINVKAAWNLIGFPSNVPE